MFYKIEINLDNAAFGDEAHIEVARILHNLSEGMKCGPWDSGKQTILDINGNVVGWAKVTK